MTYLRVFIYVFVCVGVYVGGGHCVLGRSVLSGWLTGRRATLILTLIDAVCMCVWVCGCLVSRKQRRVQGPLHSLPRDTHRSQHLDQTYTCTHNHTHSLTRSLTRCRCTLQTHTTHTSVSLLSFYPFVALIHTFCLTHTHTLTHTPCIQIEYTQQSQCAAVALSLMYRHGL